MNGINGGKGGLALITVIIIVVLLAIVVFGMANFISNSMAMSAATVGRAQAIAAAQAGVYYAIYDYKTDSSWDGSSANIFGNAYYFVGGRGGTRRQANFLLIDADNPRINGDTISRIPLSNLNQNQTLTISQFKVEWNNFSGAQLRQIYIGGSRRWIGTAASGDTITPNRNTPVEMDPGTEFTNRDDERFIFDTNIPADAIIIATFYFIDGSSRKAYLLNVGRGGNYEFSITSTGESRMNVTWRRTIEATYDVGVDRITSWQETESHL